MVVEKAGPPSAPSAMRSGKRTLWKAMTGYPSNAILRRTTGGRGGALGRPAILRCDPVPTRLGRVIATGAMSGVTAEDRSKALLRRRDHNSYIP